MSLTSDPNDPRLGHGVDDEPVDQQGVYLVLSDDERAKGFVRPVRRSYVHVGIDGPQHPTRPLSDDEQARYAGSGYVAFEPYPADQEGSALGRFWTQAQLDSVGQGCGAVTTMAQEIAETYARNPGFYGSTYCVHCRKHLKVGRDGEFIWDDGSGTRVGT